MDPQLGLRVEPGAEPGEAAAAADARIEVLDLDAGDQPDRVDGGIDRVVDSVAVAALDRDAQGTAAATLAGDEQASLDRPCDLPAAALGLVDRRPEAEQRDLPEAATVRDVGA